MRRSGRPRQPNPQPVRPTAARRATAAGNVFCSVVAWTLFAGPAVATADGGPCALARTGAHHSEGVGTWNADYPRPRRTLDALMVFLSFPDARPLLAPREVAADHFPATSRFFERSSYGRFTLRPHPLGHWIAMPAVSTAYRIQRDWDPALRGRYLRDAVAAADGAVDFAAYDLVYLVADPDAPGVDADATKVVNFGQPLQADGTALHRLVTVFENHPPDRNVLAHETGHVFDLPDLYYRPPTGSTDDWDTHVGDWDMMGSQFGLAPDPLAWHKWKLGWLARSQVRCVSRSGTSWHDLVPLGSPGGTKLVAVRTGPTSALAVEVRTATGNDAAACTEGVLLYRVRTDAGSGDGPVDVLDAHPRTEACPDTSVYPPLADAPLGVGESYTYPDGGGTRVTVTDRSQGGTWTVKVTRG